MLRPRWRVLWLAAWCVVGASILTPRGQATGGPAAVVTATDELQFSPPAVTVHVGDSVEWRNGSVLVHTVTADPALAAKASDTELPEGARPFNSGNLAPKGVFRHMFSLPGTYRYFCIPHEAAGMAGKVTVLP